MLKPQTAAERLLETIGLPRAVVSIWAWRVKSHFELRVMIDPIYRGALPEIPRRFHGYRVSVEARTPNIGLTRAFQTARVH